MEILGLPLSEHDPLLLGFLFIMAVSFINFSVLFSLWFVMHRLLAPLDSDLLKAPYFQKFEQVNCLAWPFNYWKTMIYSFLIAAPNVSRRKRFKGLEQVPEVGSLTRLLAKTHVAALLLSASMAFVYLGYFGFALYIYPRFFAS